MQETSNTLEYIGKNSTVSARSLYRGQKAGVLNLPSVKPYPAIAAAREDYFGEVVHVAE